MSITYEPTYKGHSINTNKAKKQGCETKILDKIDRMLDYSTTNHNKVFVTRLDLTYPKGYQGPKDNTHIRKFMSKFNKELKEDKLDPVSLWVREKSREKHQHYHIAVMCDGNKIQFPHKINKIAKRHWGQTINSENGGLVYYCNKSRNGEKQINSYRIRRGAKDRDKAYDDCIYRLSYLAKENTKEKDLNGMRRYGGSEIPK